MVTFEQLINMGFDEKLSMESVQKYGNRIEKCIEYISKQQSHANQASSRPSKQSITSDHDSKKRKNKNSALIETKSEKSRDLSSGLVFILSVQG